MASSEAPAGRHEVGTCPLPSLTVGQRLLAVIVVTLFVWIAAAMFWRIVNAPRHWDTRSPQSSDLC